MEASTTSTNAGVEVVEASTTSTDASVEVEKTYVEVVEACRMRCTTRASFSGSTVSFHEVLEASVQL